MRIAHVLDSLCVGGAERVVLTLADLQLQKGHAVEVHYLFSSGPLEAEFLQLGVEVHSATAPGTLKIISRLASNFKSTKPDVAHFHNATAAIYGPIAAALAGIRGRISTRHGLVPPTGGWQREAKYWLAAHLCDRAVAVSSQTERNLHAFPLSIASKITLITNGAVPAKTSSQTLPKSELFTFVHVARLNPVKDQATLLKAFAAALQQNSGLRLVLVGDGVLQDALEHLAAELNIVDRVIFVGECNTVGDWLAISDCFVLSSLTEGTPISLLEALAAGLPCIVTDVGEMPVIVNRLGCGLVVPPADPEKLSTAMLSIASMDTTERGTLAFNARRGFEEHFRPESMAQRYMEIYRKALL